MEGAKELLEKAGFDSLPDGWDAVQIKDLISNDRGLSVGVMYPGEHTPAGVPLIRSGDLNGSIINDTPSLKISLEKHVEYRRTELEGGEILISLVGSVGLCALVPKSMAGWNTARAVAVMRLKDVSEAAYVRAALLSPQLRRLMIAWSNTTVQTTLNLKEIKQLPIPWPPIETRLSIAHVLSCIDDKVALNRRMNQTLEQLVQTLFRQWFVAFDFPDTDGLPYRSSGGELVASELGEIPMGWQTGSILEIASLLSGGTPKVNEPSYWDGNIKWVSAKDISASSGSFVYDTERKITASGLAKSAAKLLPEGTTVVTARGSVGNYCILAEPMTINQSNYGLKAREADNDWYVFVMVSNMIQMMQQHAYGTIFDTITTKTFESMRVVLPSYQISAAYNQLIEPIFAKIKQNGIQSRTLATLRDTLLPQLLSGRLTVRQAEELVA